MRLHDLTGQAFGRLTVLRRVSFGQKHIKWACQCACGCQVDVSGDALKEGRTQSCGCLRTELLVERSLKHGATRQYRQTREYRAWVGAKGRCFNPKDAKFPPYGGRGITMCEGWRKDFAAFLHEMGACPPGHTLDRLEVNGDYEPGNCRWATTHQQHRNRTDTIVITYEGQPYVMADLAKALGIDARLFHKWYRLRGLSVEAIIRRRALSNSRKRGARP